MFLNNLITTYYKSLCLPLIMNLTKNDPEIAHEQGIRVLRILGRRGITSIANHFTAIRDERLTQTVFGLEFPNPVGLAAGFDKNCVALHGLQALGFGFIEAGSITQFEQAGNERPRIFRFPKDQALINRMGFNNDGAGKIAERLAETKKLRIPLGISLGMSKITPLDKAASDYLYSFKLLYPFGDYFVVNVSSPNTPGLRTLQNRENLEIVLNALIHHSTSGGQAKKPLLVKIAPDLTFEAIDELLEVCLRLGISGIIATNTTIGRDRLSTSTEEAGGLSGWPLRSKSLLIVRYLYQQLQGRLPIIGVGGVSDGHDAYEMLKAGANLIQGYTGFVYEGPLFAKNINEKLLTLMDRDGVTKISTLQGT